MLFQDCVHEGFEQGLGVVNHHSHYLVFVILVIKNGYALNGLVVCMNRVSDSKYEITAFSKGSNSW